MIFQSYALWPHMTVFQNVAFPFEARGRRGPEVTKRIMDVLAMVGLETLASRSASLLSGGQMQRVALARALACEPAALLFDEPLSNLDLKLRQHLRVELRELQKASGATAVFVTHDQAEAAALADRVIVMNEGRIEQDDSAEVLFSRPANRFVAEFISVGNLLPFQPTGRIDSRTWRGDVKQVLDLTVETYAKDELSGKLWIWFRPEAVHLGASPQSSANHVQFTGRIIGRSFTGLDYTYDVRIGEANEVKLTMSNKVKMQPGESIPLWVAARDIHLISEHSSTRRESVESSLLLS
jgi:iron(III) transport system ATP-binding protein